MAEIKPYSGSVTIEEVVLHLRKNYTFTHNPQYKGIDGVQIFLNHGKNTRIEFTDLCLRLKTEDIKISDSTLKKILLSKDDEFKVTKWGTPLADWLNKLASTWDGKDYIQQLCNYIVAAPIAPNAQQRHDKYLRKWLLSFVATILKPDYKNVVMFTYVDGVGRIGKSNLWAYLFELFWSYGSVVKPKDVRHVNFGQLVEEKNIIVLEEISMSPKKYNEFKEAIGADHRLAKNRKGSFFALTNQNNQGSNRGFIDIAEPSFLKRICAVEIAKILHPEVSPADNYERVNREQLYAQCAHIVNHLPASNYTWNTDDWNDFARYNVRYCNEVDIHQHLEAVVGEPPTDTEPHTWTRPTDIFNKLLKKGVNRKQTSPKAIGTWLSNNNFERAEKRQGDGWYYKVKAV